MLILQMQWVCFRTYCNAFSEFDDLRGALLIHITGALQKVINLKFERYGDNSSLSKNNKTHITASDISVFDFKRSNIQYRVRTRGWSPWTAVGPPPDGPISLQLAQPGSRYYFITRVGDIAYVIAFSCVKVQFQFIQYVNTAGSGRDTYTSCLL